MKNFKKIGALLFLSTYLLIGVSFGTPTFAAENSIQFVPQIGIPGTEFVEKTGVSLGEPTNSTLLARYVAAFYNWGLSIVGVVAVLIMMAGGILWLTSGGDTGKIGDAKKMIQGSLLGTFLLLGAYLLLNTINPDLTKLPAIQISSISNQEIDTDFLSSADKMKFVCLPEGMTCTNTAPPTLNLNLKACINKYGDMPNCDKDFDKTGHMITWCCGLDENTQAKANIFCADKDNGESCKINETALDKSGYCYNKECKACLNYGTACNKNYECREPNSDAPRCGDGASGNDCNSGYCANTTKDQEGETCGAENAGKCLEYNLGFVCPGATQALSGGTSCGGGLKCCK